MAKTDPVWELYKRMAEHMLDLARTHRRPVRRFRASEAATCVRQIYYRLQGQRPAPKSPDLLIYGSGGEVDHDLTRQFFQDFGIEIGGVTFHEDGGQEEQPFTVKRFEVEGPKGPVTFNVSARPDGFIDTPRCKDSLLEIKGKGFYVFDWLQKAYVAGYKTLDGGKIKPGHRAVLTRVKEKDKPSYMQCQVTMNLTDRTHCYLVYKDRSTGQLGFLNEETGERTGVYLTYDTTVFEAILKRFAVVEQALIDGKAPVAEFPPKSKECSYCPFYYLCHGAALRRDKGQKPAILYPGPQMEVHNDEE